MGKGENAGNQHFLLFPLCFLPYQRENAPYVFYRIKGKMHHMFSTLSKGKCTICFLPYQRENAPYVFYPIKGKMHHMFSTLSKGKCTICFLPYQRENAPYVFYPIKGKMHHMFSTGSKGKCTIWVTLSYTEFVICRCFQFSQGKNFVNW